MRRKKWIGLILSMVMILTMVACGGAADEISLGDTSSETMSETVSEDVSETDSETVSEEKDVPSESEVADSENQSEEESSKEEKTSEEESASEEESVSEEESESEEPEFTVQDHDAILFVKKAVNVRIGPSTDYEKIGGLSKGEQIQITGIADTGWYRIQYNGAEAYVASSYLIDETAYQA
ncbi:MAG: SH3 domain-containing protein, partial [Lachnospiraceae bacterium]|nr:SH3 domain-containing protein [Lachnospiraceae bacterium]